MGEYHELVKSMGKDEILKAFPEVVPLAQSSLVASLESSQGSGAVETHFEGHDEEQIRLMNENCIVLDYDDQVVGAGTKKLCHLMTSIDRGLLHRAFSVFIFNEKDELLLQQRSDEKITFPGMWTNTCCSHPLCVSDELNGIQGAKVAAVRKLDHELGIESKYIPIEDFKFLTKIHYMAPNGDAHWGEHEIDYILIIRLTPNLDKLNYNEVKDVKYVSQDSLQQMFKDNSLKFTPWFKLICENYLFKWWDNLDHLDDFVINDIQRLL